MPAGYSWAGYSWHLGGNGLRGVRGVRTASECPTSLPVINSLLLLYGAVVSHRGSLESKGANDYIFLPRGPERGKVTRIWYARTVNCFVGRSHCRTKISTLTTGVLHEK